MTPVWTNDSEKIDQNHAQNVETGDNGETGVIFSIEGGREQRIASQSSSNAIPMLSL